MLQFFSRWISANQLTALRVLLIPVIMAMMVMGPEQYWMLLGAWTVFFFACMTDYWDGLIARYQRKTTKLGILLDPIADKLLIASLLILLVEMARSPALPVILLIAREIAVTGLRGVAAAEGLVIAASSGGKTKTISQMIAVGLLILHYEVLWIPCHELGLVMLWVATVISFWSGIRYVLDYYRTLPEP
ncbi:MAG TPA: CDP-diacylglycerol--glycerol-3-phosphate 3-phosphatidyltransferase [Deltaproteobacteria bacterium]|jgi:CDP-diacylglycerol--glycerol-3-phosphate 3-phosphatidyltransferase|nr:CDP-diacylglycerol--glycerol-3-phosphate 3-phosphatidyltransferase [Candidatus Lambdaproteobacteria bacterium]HIL14566.1 CDP-diacylglycerol--glycerol-3-phosphate 3-phosphatidyltransferase [Deltaproteobacteria bacterium]